MRKDQVNQEVKIAQGILDKVVPGKVKVKAEYDSERRCNILVGKYLSYTKENPRGGACAWTESMDRFYTDSKLFVRFFKQRAKYMNASIEEQAAFDGHPAMY